MGKAVVGGVIAGLIGAAIWGGITYATSLEIGWIAWGIGFLVGLGVRVGSGGEDGNAFGLIAAAIALGSVLAGKLFAVYLFVASIPAFDVQLSPQSMIVGYALDICEERAAKGKPVRFAPGMSVDKANNPQDFPKDVWQEASKRWEKLGPAAQQDEIKKRQALIQQLGDNFKGELRAQGFRDSFSPFDLLWGFLAIGTAYKLASGLAGSE
jgi:hypothetical protein